MEPSSKTTDLPPGVEQLDLYDGPKVVHLPSGRATFVADAPAPEALTRPIPQPPAQPPAPAPSAPTTAEIKAAYPAAIELALDVIGHKARHLVALITACLLWAYVVVVAADPLHIVGASVFSVLILGPMLLTEWRRAGAGGET